MEVEETLPKEYVDKPNDEELLILNDTMSEPITPIQENQQEQGETSTSLEQESTTTSLVKGPSARV